MGDELVVASDGAVRILTLNRPDRHNAFNDELYEALRLAVHDAAADATVRAILLRGAGRSFSSGRDTGVLGQHGTDGEFAFLHRAQEVNRTLRGCRMPVIVALKGAVFGKALEIALAADFRVAAADCRLALPEVHFGLCTDNGGGTHATRLAGPSRAKYLLMSGDPVDGATALAWGLVDWVVAIDELDQFALDLARRLAARAPLPVALAKQLVNQLDDGAVSTGFRTEMLAQLALFGSEDYQEARQARREGREPAYQGR